MKIDEQEVKRIAKLARLYIPDAEVAGFTRQFNEIIAYVETLEHCGTEGVKPTAHVTLEVAGTRTPMREDVVRKSLPADEVLKNAPARDEVHFRVPAIIHPL